MLDLFHVCNCSLALNLWAGDQDICYPARSHFFQVNLDKTAWEINSQYPTRTQCLGKMLMNALWMDAENMTPFF